MLSCYEAYILPIKRTRKAVIGASARMDATSDVWRPRLVILPRACLSTVPGRPETPKSANKSRWFSGCTCLPGTAGKKMLENME
mgnify:CR=1 FL=1